MDYSSIGLKVGIEVHQELATKHKLFCSCPPKLNDEKADFTFLRRLRPSQSELGEVDPAALFEFLKGKQILYEGNHDTSCLVEMDEEPPGSLDPETLDLTLCFSMMVGSKPVDEIHVMRKTVVDGSNTGGFQRTCVVSHGGSVEVQGKRYGIQQISLEEDAARNIGEDGNLVKFRIDRLGIPLLEISTEPDMHAPDEVQAVAQRIGTILRATGKVKRGIGTIRQDVNVSIKGGPVVEIKGVQDLALLPTIIEYETSRQWNLLEIMGEIKSRKLVFESILDRPIDVSEVFKNTECRVIKNALKTKGKVLAVKLDGFKGLIGKELCPGRRLGTEMSDRAKFRSGVKGIFHTDELPAYDIKEQEVKLLKSYIDASEDDAVVIIADEEVKSKRALTAVVERAKEGFFGVPLETRSANPDGTTRFTRPRPGAARMYPETDVKTISVTKDYLEKIRANLPEMPEEKLKRFMSSYGLNEKLAKQIIDSEYLTVFEEISKSLSHLTTLAAVILTEEIKNLQRDGILVENIPEMNMIDIFKAINLGETAKESIPQILTWLVKNPGHSVYEAIEVLNIKMMSAPEIEAFVEKKLAANQEIIKRMGEKASGPLMGMVMSEVRGRANASTVQKIIITKIKEILSQ